LFRGKDQRRIGLLKIRTRWFPCSR